jgi:poly-beta-hydroxybutyrate-responsive repressor
MCHKSNEDHACLCPGGKTERYLQPSLLLALHLKTSYGYDLLGKINDFGFVDGSLDPGTVYHHLRRLEDDGFVSSKWDTSGTGPARRFYDITREGETLLKNWVMFMERNYNNLGNFLSQYNKTSSKKGTSRQSK